MPTLAAIISTWNGNAIASFTILFLLPADASSGSQPTEYQTGDVLTASSIKWQDSSSIAADWLVQHVIYRCLFDHPITRSLKICSMAIIKWNAWQLQICELLVLQAHQKVTTTVSRGPDHWPCPVSAALATGQLPSARAGQSVSWIAVAMAKWHVATAAQTQPSSASCNCKSKCSFFFLSC